MNKLNLSAPKVMVNPKENSEEYQEIDIKPNQPEDYKFFLKGKFSNSG